MVGADGPERDHTRRKWQSSSYPASLKPKLCFQLLAAGHEAAPRGPAPLLSLPTCSVQRQFGKVITGPSKHPQPPLTSGSPLATLANVPVLSTPSSAPSSRLLLSTSPAAVRRQPWRDDSFFQLPAAAPYRADTQGRCCSLPALDFAEGNATSCIFQ